MISGRNDGYSVGFTRWFLGWVAKIAIGFLILAAIAIGGAAFSHTRVPPEVILATIAVALLLIGTIILYRFIDK